MSHELVEGKVAQILSEREVVINKGARDGVKNGTRFAILAAAPTKIVDPETEEELGEVDRTKVRVEATLVQDRIAVCRTYETRRVGGGLLPDVSDYFGPSRTVAKTFKVVEYPAAIAAKDSYVKIGDRVMEIVD